MAERPVVEAPRDYGCWETPCIKPGRVALHWLTRRSGTPASPQRRCGAGKLTAADCYYPEKEKILPSFSFPRRACLFFLSRMSTPFFVFRMESPTHCSGSVHFDSITIDFRSFSSFSFRIECIENFADDFFIVQKEIWIVN